MLHGEGLGLFVGAVALGAIHGVEPGHGWPVAATYALDRSNKWVYGVAASLVIGVGHLVSSIAMVAAFFYAKNYFDLAQANEPMTVLGGVQIGGPVGVVAGVVLVALGIREYAVGHSHSHHEFSDHDFGHHGGDGHAHDHGDERSHGSGDGHAHDHGTDHDHRSGDGWGHSDDHSHGHDHGAEATDRGLWGIAWFAFVLGFAHEEEFEIIALCAGSTYCLELMTAYALTVVVGIVGLTMLLIAGYEHYEERVRRYTPYLPAFSATVLVVMGLGFVTGLL